MDWWLDSHLHLCPHLVGVTLPRWPQTMPSESCQVSQRKPETPATSSSTPGIEASAPQGVTADVPAPMETGGAGNGQSWVEQVEVEDDFKRDRQVTIEEIGRQTNISLPAPG